MIEYPLGVPGTDTVFRSDEEQSWFLSRCCGMLCGWLGGRVGQLRARGFFNLSTSLGPFDSTVGELLQVVRPADSPAGDQFDLGRPAADGTEEFQRRRTALGPDAGEVDQAAGGSPAGSSR